MNSKQLYDLCIKLAIESPCQKRGFGCLLASGDLILCHAFNKPNECSKHICDPICVRFNILSGSDSMLGACGHAEEQVIWQALNDGINVRDLVLYVAGVSKPDNTPLIKTESSFYCIRCATLMYYAGIAGVYTYVNDDWIYSSTNAAYESSLFFAMKQKHLGNNQA